MIIVLVMLGSFVVSASASVPSAFAANVVTFYSTPQSATITVGSNIELYGWSGTFAPGDRVHVIANFPTSSGANGVSAVSPETRGRWEFQGWVTVGASVDSPMSRDTYITIGQGQGSVRAVWQRVPQDNVIPPPAPSNEPTPPPPPPTNDDRSDNID
jgi:hypothetical protein